MIRSDYASWHPSFLNEVLLILSTNTFKSRHLTDTNSQLIEKDTAGYTRDLYNFSHEKAMCISSPEGLEEDISPDVKYSLVRFLNTLSVLANEASLK